MDTSNNEVPGPLNPELFSRVQAVDNFRKFVERGITNPDDLDLNDPEVIEANRILDIWDAEQRKLADDAGTLAARLEYNLSRSTILVDAGFSDPDYLDEVANDWLGGNDLADAQEAGLTEIAEMIQTRIDEINNRLNQKK
jgi:hypothetical protein